MTIGELLIKLGIVADTDKAKGFSAALKDVTIGSAATVAGLIGVSLQFKHLFEESIDAAMGLQMFQSQTGLSTEQLQKWQIVAERANVSAESVSTSITALQRNIADIRMGKGNIAPFQMLGIDIQQSPFAILNQLRERIAGLPKPLAANLIQQLGFSPDMIQLLSLSTKQLKELAGPDLIISEKGQRKLLATRLEIVKLRQEFMAWSRHMMVELAPAFKVVGTAVEHTMMAIKGISDTIVESKTAFTMLIGLVTALALRFYPITTAIMGLLMLLDDLYVYTKGGKSLMGEALGNYKGVTKERGIIDDLAAKIGLEKYKASLSATPGFLKPSSQIIYNKITLTPSQFADLPREQQEKYLKGTYTATAQQLDNAENK